MNYDKSYTIKETENDTKITAIQILSILLKQSSFLPVTSGTILHYSSI